MSAEKIDPPESNVPHTDEVQRKIDFVEKVTGRKVVLFNCDWTERSRRAAYIAASRAYGLEKSSKFVPSVVEARELIELTGLEAQSPFKPVACPLVGERLELALSYIRQCFKLNPEVGVGRDMAIAFVKWAKENTQ